MKKIYTITLEDDIPLSDKTINDVKVICYLLYDDIREIEEKPGSILYQKNTRSNKLTDKFNGQNYVYHFTSEANKEKWQNYEPFIISDNIFGFTVNDETITDSEISMLIEETQKLLGSNYKFNINSYLYMHDYERIRIINSLNKKEIEPKVKHSKIKLRTMLSLMGM